MRTPGAAFGRPSRACAPPPGSGRKVLVDQVDQADPMNPRELRDPGDPMAPMVQIVEVSITKR